MNLTIYKDYEDLSIAAAALIVDSVKKKPTSLLCFATGDSPKLTYQLMTKQARADKVDFSRCFMIGLDEWMGVPVSNSGSCHWFLHEYIFKPLAIDSSRIHLFDAFTKNAEQECDRMDKFIEDHGGVDVMVVGVGMNGHIGFNEPNSSLDARAHVSELEEITRAVGQKYFSSGITIGNGLTIGLSQVMDAKKLLMLANGEKKSKVIKRTLEGKVGIDFPATLIREHENSFLMIDEQAASELKQTSQ